MRKLKVRAVQGHLQPNFEAFSAGVRRFIGWKFDSSLGTRGGFVPLPDGEEIPYRAEYVQALKEGALAPMDYETAQICGVNFDTYHL